MFKCARRPLAQVAANKEDALPTNKPPSGGPAPLSEASDDTKDKGVMTTSGGTASKAPVDAAVGGPSDAATQNLPPETEASASSVAAALSDDKPGGALPNQQAPASIEADQVDLGALRAVANLVPNSKLSDALSKAEEAKLDAKQFERDTPQGKVLDINGLAKLEEEQMQDQLKWSNNGNDTDAYNQGNETAHPEVPLEPTADQPMQHISPYASEDLTMPYTDEAVQAMQEGVEDEDDNDMTPEFEQWDGKEMPLTAEQRKAELYGDPDFTE